jgi:uncharacterized protein YbcC (UPF0753/DUF2309 family)
MTPPGLHSYEWRKDTDGSVLQGIVAGAVLVPLAVIGQALKANPDAAKLVKTERVRLVAIDPESGKFLQADELDAGRQSELSPAILLLCVKKTFSAYKSKKIASSP